MAATAPAAAAAAKENCCLVNITTKLRSPPLTASLAAQKQPKGAFCISFEETAASLTLLCPCPAPVPAPVAVYNCNNYLSECLKCVYRKLLQLPQQECLYFCIFVCATSGA